MARREIDAFWDRKTRNDLNENFKELYDKDDNIQQQVNDLVLESGGDSNLEVVQARGGHRVLNDRLNSIDSQLAQVTRNKAEVKDVEELNDRIDEIITTPAEGVSEQEIIDARNGKESLGANVREIRERTNTNLVNVIKNGDFKEGHLNDYGVLYGKMQLSEYVEGIPEYHSVVLTANGSSTYGSTIYQALQDSIPTLDKWYIKARMRTWDEGVFELRAGFRGTSGITNTGIPNPTIGEWYDVSHVFDPSVHTHLSGEFRSSVYANYYSQINNEGKRIEVDNIIAINLTEFFGYGNEPTKDEMDDLLSEFPYMYFDEKADSGTVGSFLMRENNSQKLRREMQNELQKIEQDLVDVSKSFLKNEIQNGDFSVETSPTGWSTEGNSTWNISNNTMEMIGLGNSTIVGVRQTTDIQFIPGKKLYVSGLFTANNNDVRSMGFAVFSDIAGNTIQYLTSNDFTVGVKKKISGIITLPSEGSGNLRLQLRATYPNSSSSDGQSIEINNVLMIDLTETFGEGKEPTKEQMDELINNFPNQWFDGLANVIDIQKSMMSYVFNNKEKGVGGLKRPLIAVTFDDGFRSDIDLVYPEFKNRGVVGTSYIWTDRTDNYAGAMNVEDLIELKLNGWGVECHTRNHPRLNDLTDEEIHEQMQFVNQDFERFGLPLPQHHALPYGSGGNVARVQNILMQYRKSIRNIQSNSNGVYNDWDTIDFSALNARSVDGTDDIKIETLKDDIDLTVSNDGILVLIVHKVVLENPGQYETPLHRLLAVVDYAIEKGMKFVTIDEMYNRVMEYQESINA